MAGRTVGYWLYSFLTYQGVDLHRLEQRIFLGFRHSREVVEGVGVTFGEGSKR
jgi:hypothetical protein